MQLNQFAKSYRAAAIATATPSQLILMLFDGALRSMAIALNSFQEPDLIRFPALRLARDALRAGGGTPAILNAANEVAVEAFLQRRIGFLDIVETVERVLDTLGCPVATTLDEVIALDEEARRTASEFATAKAA